jgi:hypothetical protein
MSDRREYNIYVIELDPAVLKEKRFLEANPTYLPGKLCVYVGMTARSPEERFEQHLRGYKSARYVRKYGQRLRPRLFRSHNPMTYEEACAMEREKARRLRNRGYGVWQK